MRVTRPALIVERGGQYVDLVGTAMYPKDTLFGVWCKVWKRGAREPFLGWVEGCDPVKAATELNTEWILIDSRFPISTHLEPPIHGAPEGNPWGTLAEAHWLTSVASSGTVQLWQVSS